MAHAPTVQSQLKQLFNWLDKATDLLADFSGGYSNDFSSAEEFHNALVASKARLQEGDLNEIKSLHFWFLPGCEWDDFTDRDGQSLGNRISQLLSILLKSIRLNS